MSMELHSEHAFAAARPLAQHCPQLVKDGPRPEERTEALSLWRRILERAFALDLEELLGGKRPSVTLGEAQAVSGADVFARIGPIAANSLLRCDAPGSETGRPIAAGTTEQAKTVLFSADFSTAIALTDRSFGGKGAADEDTPDQLPRSAALLLDQVALRLAKAIAQASTGKAETEGAAEPVGEVIVRSESASRLKPFDPDSECQMFEVRIAAGEDIQWIARIAMSDPTLEALLPGSSALQAKPGTAPPEMAAGAIPFADIPMGLEAVLAEFEMSLERLEHLAPGDHISLAVARDIPLRMGTETFAHGSVGALEDRMALRITRFPSHIAPAGLST